jgi:ribosomal protein S18 acetylase RimI-like enzyme
VAERRALVRSALVSYHRNMEIRPITTADLATVDDIDGSIRSTHYLHVVRDIGPTSFGWRLEERELRQAVADSNRMNDDTSFALKSIAGGVEEGYAQWIELDNVAAGMVVAQPRPGLGTLHVLDLRVDFDYRRQGLGTVLLLGLLGSARDAELRAVTAECSSSNLPAAKFLRKLGFEPAGLDTHRSSNHDLVKERATVLWVCALD